MPIFPQLEERHLQDPIGTMRQVISHIFDELNRPDSSFGYYFYLFLNMRFQKTAPLPRFQVPQRELRPFGVIMMIIGAGQDLGLFALGEKRDIAILFFATMRGLTYAKLNEQGNYALPSIDALMNLFLRKAV